MSAAQPAAPLRAPAPPAPARAARPLKVMIVCPHFGPPWNEGVKNLVRVLDEQLRARGIATVVFPLGTIPRASERPVGYAVRALAGKLGRWRRAARAARREGVDLIHVMSSITSAAGLKLATLRRLSGVPVVAHFTGVGAPRAGYSWLMSADRVLVGGEYLLRYFPDAESVPPLSPHVADPAAAPPREPDPARPRRRILFLGAMERVRGVQTLVAALGLLRRDPAVADFTLTIAWNGFGEPGWDAAIRALIAEAGIEDRVEWQVGDADVPALYRGHDVLVVPRLGGTRMSFPLRIVESMSYGTPVVASDAGEMPRIVEGCGLIFPRGDHAALADALRSLLTDDALYARSVRASLARAAEFAPARTIDRIVSAYHHVLHVE